MLSRFHIIRFIVFVTLSASLLGRASDTKSFTPSRLLFHWSVVYRDLYCCVVLLVSIVLCTVFVFYSSSPLRGCNGYGYDCDDASFLFTAYALS